MLWPTVSRPIRLGVEHPLETHDQIFLFPFFCLIIALLFDLERPLWREDGSAICSAISRWSESRRTHNYILLSHLRLLSSLFVASYDSQGYGGSILNRLYTDVLALIHSSTSCLVTCWHGPQTKTISLSQRNYCICTCWATHVVTTQPLLINDRCLKSHYLATADVYLLISRSFPSSFPKCQNTLHT
jgi:hypothetical protein